MFRLMIYLIIFYLIWKLLQPYLQRLLNANIEVHGKSKQKKINIDPNDIEDAEFREIDDNKSV